METGSNKRLTMHSKCLMASTLADLGSLSGGMTETSISEGSEPLPCSGQAVVAVISNSQLLKGMEVLRAGQVNPMAPGL